MIGLRSLVEPTRASRWVRTLDVRVKLVFLLVAAVLVVLIDAPLTLLGILTVVVALYLASGIPAGKLATAAGIALLTVWGTMLSQALFYASVPRTAVFEIIPRGMPVIGELTGGLRVYREGLIYGAVQSSRIVTMVGLGLLVCWTTDAGAFLSALVRLRVPYAIAFMTVTALRFLPVVVSEAGVVTTARRMRGYHLRWGLAPFRVFAKRCLSPYSLKPIFANAIRRSRALALSVESRAFDPTSRRTTARSEKGSGAGTGSFSPKKGTGEKKGSGTFCAQAPFGPTGKRCLTPFSPEKEPVPGEKVPVPFFRLTPFQEIAVIAFLLISLLLVVAMKLLHWTFMHEVYYSQDLRWLYDFVRAYL